MKTGPVIHGALLAIALGIAYQGLTEDEAPDRDVGDVAVWSMPAGSITAIAYDEEKKSIKIEVKEAGGERYLWGIESRTRKVRKDKDEETDAHGHDHDHGPGEAETEAAETDNDKAASEAGAKAEAENKDKDKAAAETETEADPETEADTEPEKATEPEMTTETVVTEFPVGDRGEKLVETFTSLKALRDLGPLTDDEKKTYELADTKRQVTVFFADGSNKVLAIGGNVYGSGDRYVLDPESGHGYALASEVLRPLSSGQSMLRLRDLHAFTDDDVARAVVATESGERTLVRVDPDGEEGKKPAGWADAQSPDEPDLTLKNFIDRIDGLRAREYSPDEDTASVTEIATVTYFDEEGEKLGYLSFYKREAAASATEESTDSEEGEAPDEKKPEVEYFLRSERTRVLGVVSPLSAGRVLQDLDQMFGDGDASADPETGEASESAPASTPAPPSTQTQN